MRNSYTIDDVKTFILEKHPKSIVLSKEYKNRTAKLDIICENGHNFFPTFSDLKYKNSWCPECYGNKKYSEEEVKEYIQKLHPKAKFISCYREKNE